MCKADKHFGVRSMNMQAFTLKFAFIEALNAVTYVILIIKKMFPVYHSTFSYKVSYLLHRFTVHIQTCIERTVRHV